MYDVGIYCYLCVLTAFYELFDLHKYCRRSCVVILGVMSHGTAQRSFLLHAWHRKYSDPLAIAGHQSQTKRGVSMTASTLDVIRSVSSSSDAARPM
jgi:hypothetical protein